MLIVGLSFAYLLVLAMFVIPFAITLWVISALVRDRSRRLRTTALVIATALLFAPVWGPATIAVVPVPFGSLLLISALTLDFNSLTGVMALTPAWWYPITCALTALLALLVLTIHSRGTRMWANFKHTSGGASP